MTRRPSHTRVLLPREDPARLRALREAITYERVTLFRVRSRFLFPAPIREVPAETPLTLRRLCFPAGGR